MIWVFGYITLAFGNNYIGTMIYIDEYICHDYLITSIIGTKRAFKLQ
jgi:hypothetical protein